MLNIGKISENVLKRSVLKRIKHKKKDVVIGAKAGVDAALIRLAQDKYLSTSTETVAYDTPLAATLAVQKAVNNVSVSGARPISISVSISLPVGEEETYIKSVITEIDDLCKSLDIVLTGGHTEVTDSVVRPVISVTACGVSEDKSSGLKNAKCGDDIIITKQIALSGTAVIADRNREALTNRFAPAFVQRAIDCKDYISVVPEAAIAVKNGASSMHDLSYGGVYAALWELGEASHAGLCVDLMKIPVMQETVEVCEEYDINPYELLSDGSMLITSPDGNRMLEALHDSGINAVIIGKITDNNDRIIVNGDEVRYINIPKTDEIHKIFGNV